MCPPVNGCNCHQYHENKMQILRQLLNTNEGFLGQIKDWEAYDDHLDKRDQLIDELKELDENCDPKVISACDSEQVEEVNRTLNLILALDKDISSAMEEIRLETLESMKSTIISKKITDYVYSEPVEQSGRLLDYKK